MTFMNLRKLWKVIFTSNFLQHELSVLFKKNFPAGTCQTYYHHGRATPSFQPDHHGISELASHWRTGRFDAENWPGPVVSMRRTGQGDQRTSTRQITGRLIPQDLRLQEQVKLASLGWCHKLWKWANFCARRFMCFCSQSGGGASIGSAYVAAAIMWLRTEGRKVRETCAECCQVIWLGLCGCNIAI